MEQQPGAAPSYEVRVIAHGRIRDKAHLDDFRKGCITDGYIKAIVCEPISHYWQMAWPVIIFDNMPDMKGNALILYLGTPESFAGWRKGMMEALELAARTRPKTPVGPPRVN